MTPEELVIYDRFINTTSNEWDIYYWAVGTKELPEEYRNTVIEKFVEHAKNADREERFKQPNL